MIESVTYIAPAPSEAIAITMADGSIWQDDAGLPPDNEIRAALADWIAAGGVIGAYVAPPASIEPRSSHVAWIEAALAEIGKLEAVNAAVAAAGPVKLALWRRATTIKISDPDIAAIAAAIKIDLTALFDRADALRRARE